MREHTADDSVDAVIVGAGPVGSALALLLGARGRRALVLERHDAPYPLPRAVHFDDEAARILQACGLGDDLPELSEPATAYEWRNGDGVPLLRFEMPLKGSQGWPTANMFNQPDLERRLHDAIRRSESVALRWGHDVVDVGQSESQAWVEVRVGDATKRVAASYVIACDGANSTVRGILDMPLEDRGFFFDWLVVDVSLREPRVFDPPNLQVCDPHRPTTVVSGGPGRRRWEFMCLPGETLEEIDDETAAWRFLEPWDVRPDNAEMIRHAGYRFRARWATRWHEGRVFLAGDAAHQTPPFAGQGMCAGLRDAANLAWKIDHVLSHPGAAQLLDTYDLERIPQASAVIEFATELGRVICIPDVPDARARDEQMAPLVSANSVTIARAMPGIESGLLDSSDLAGSRFPQGIVRRAEVEGRFDDVVGVGWRLVTAGDNADLEEELTTWFESIGGRCIALGTEVIDVSGDYDEWFGAHGVVAALQRPDFYVFGTASVESGTAELIRRLRSQFESHSPRAFGIAETLTAH